MAGKGDLEDLADAALVRRISDLDAEALAVLYDRHAIAAVSLARAMVGRELADDAVHDAFIAVWRNADHFDAVHGPAREWLLGLVRRTCIDALRRLEPDERREIADRRAHGANQANVGAVEAAGLRRIRAELPDDQWRVLELAFFGGWTQVEIAEQLGVSVDAVRHLMRLAFKHLRVRRGGEVKGSE